jgi:hypothetical protein
MNAPQSIFHSSRVEFGGAVDGFTGGREASASPVAGGFTTYRRTYALRGESRAVRLREVRCGILPPPL